MIKLVAIGGGENGRPGTEYETKQIDEEIVKLSGKKHPNVLFIPPPSKFQEDYFKVMQKVFVRLGCDIFPLYLSDPNPNKKILEDTILNADIIYVGGGNTLNMLKYWRKHGIDNILKKVVNKDIVLSGLSAGAICWFKYGNSDSLKFSDGRNPLIKVWGLDFVPLMICPHYDVEADRKPSLRRMIKGQGGIAIALDNCTAIQVQDGQYRILTSSRNAHAYKVYRKDGKVIQEQIPVSKDFKSLDELILK